MAKNQDKRQEVPEPPVRLPTPQLPPQAPVSNARIWVFWCAVALAVIAARVLNHMLPGISESVIERWVMLAFGVFLALFLLKLK
ncbi:MAG: hypothetical protein Q7R35_16635 [Elusimicrobiota bacterium]|nr:hypothetical protein [Elusimicrobiota bacterium]